MNFLSSLKLQSMLYGAFLFVLFIIFVSVPMTTRDAPPYAIYERNSSSDASKARESVFHDAQRLSGDSTRKNTRLDAAAIHPAKSRKRGRGYPKHAAFTRSRGHYVNFSSVTSPRSNDVMSRTNDVRGDVVRSRIEIEMAKLRNEIIGDPIVYDRNNLPPDLKALAAPIFGHFPKNYLPNYKSPCWRDSSGYLKCLPYFFIAGFPKCATTDLWSKISKHPDIVVTLKEPMWWTSGEFTEKGLNKYISHQTKLATAMTTSKRKDLVNSDSSALTLQDNRYLMKSRYHNDTLRRKLPYVTADVIRALLPNTKIIGIMRDPVDRAWSAYNYFNKFAKKWSSPQGFHQVVTKQRRAFYKCLEKNELRYCAYTTTDGPLLAGCYSIYLRDWLKRFPRDQLFFLRTEDFDKADQPDILAEIYKFLDLDIPTEQEIRQMTYGKNKNIFPSRIQMLPETKQLLADFYRPCNQDLAILLGDEKYLWNK